MTRRSRVSLLRGAAAARASSAAKGTLERGDERTRSMVRGFVDMFYLMSKSLLYGRLGNTQQILADGARGGRAAWPPSILVGFIQMKGHPTLTRTLIASISWWLAPGCGEQPRNANNSCVWRDPLPLPRATRREIGSWRSFLPGFSSPARDSSPTCLRFTQGFMGLWGVLRWA